jgi:hypothetical protein
MFLTQLELDAVRETGHPDTREAELGERVGTRLGLVHRSRLHRRRSQTCQRSEANLSTIQVKILNLYYHILKHKSII